MGTNYYLCNKHLQETLHIGKSSFGWYFALHVYPDRGINDLEDWEKLWSLPGYSIIDEYWEPVSIEAMRSEICDRKLFQPSPMQKKGGDAWEQFKLRNFAVDGLNNLLRCKPDKSRGISHGVGTWDLIDDDFT